jgi:integrase
MEGGMKKHLTDLAVERMKLPKTGSMDVFDLGYPGLYLRIGHGGAKSFGLFYVLNKKLTRESLGRWPAVSLANAREAWRKTRESIAKGQAPQHDGKNNSALLFEHVVEEWLKRDQASTKSLHRTTRMVEHDLLPAWRGKLITEIGKPEIVALIDGIVDRGAPVKARRVHAYVSRLLKWCEGRGLISGHPMHGLESPGKETARERVLTDSELIKVWSAASKVRIYGDVVKLLILTGARREEIGALRWDEIKGDHILLGNGRTKTGKPHIIPLVPATQKILEAIPHLGEFVFSSDGAKPVSAWSGAKHDLDDMSGVENWRIHDLRRTTATGMEKLKIPLQVVEACLGHKGGSKGGIVGVYQRHDYANEKRAALEAWANHLLPLVS